MITNFISLHLYNELNKKPNRIPNKIKYNKTWCINYDWIDNIYNHFY